MKIAQKFVHLVFPHESNNQKAKLLHTSTFVLISLGLLLVKAALYFLPQTGLKILGYAANIPPLEVVRLTNEKRVQSGLAPLEYNQTLADAAKAKGEDMLSRDYWAHIGPDGTEPWKFFTDSGYQYRYAGENLARDFSNANSAVEAWIASPTHKDNLLSSKYKEIGIAVIEGDLGGVETTLIIQFFGTKYESGLPSVPVAKAQPATEIKAVETLVPQAQKEIVSLPKPKIIISPFQTTKNISLIIIGILLAILAVDRIIISRKRIVRIGGRTLAHISYLGMILALALIAKAGRIL